jgi:hypothetical protein
MGIDPRATTQPEDEKAPATGGSVVGAPRVTRKVPAFGRRARRRYEAVRAVVAERAAYAEAKR